MIVHVESEVLQQTGVQIELTAQEMSRHLDRLRTAVEEIDMHWHGGVIQAEILNGYNDRIRILRRQVALLEQLARKIRMESVRWEECDLQWMHTHNGVSHHVIG